MSCLQKAGTFPMTQNRALQLLYDLRYLSIILTAKSEEAKSSRIKHDSRCGAVLGFSSSSQKRFKPTPLLAGEQHLQARCLWEKGRLQALTSSPSSLSKCRRRGGILQLRTWRQRAGSHQRLLLAKTVKLPAKS